MANPFLVLGGVAVGVITAGIGALQVPGWIDSANDSAARNDLSQVALAQEAAMTTVGTYITDADLKDGEVGSGATAVSTGVKYQPSDGVKTGVAHSADGKKWVAVSLSKSGHAFLRTSESTTVVKSTNKITGNITAGSFGTLPTGISTTGFTIGGTLAGGPTVVLTP